MTASKEQTARALIDFNEKNPGKTQEIAKAFVDFYKKQGIEYQLPRLLEVIEYKEKEKREERVFRVVLATEAEHNLIGELKRALRIPENTKEEVFVDKNLKAGFIAYWGGKRYDGSARSQLEKMKKKIKNNF